MCIDHDQSDYVCEQCGCQIDCNCKCHTRKVKCDTCNKECNLGDCGNSISVSFPYGHELDGSHDRILDTPHEFCSSECLIKYIKKGSDT